MLPRLWEWGKVLAMSDFNTALGILQKAIQGNLFAKHKSAHTNLVEGDHHPKILGTTRSGKEVLGKPSSSPDKFLEHHRGWIANDHEDATDIHHDHQNHASLALSRKWLLAPSFDAVDYLASSRMRRMLKGEWMSDFNKALGILQKAIQGDLFSKPKPNVKAMGKTDTGKVIDNSNNAFIQQHKEHHQ